MTTDTSNKIVENWLQCAFYFTSAEIVVRSIKVFHKLDEIFNNANIGIRGFTTWKQQIPVTKCYSQWVLNPWASDSKSNTLLSELIWHVLLRRSLNFCSCRIPWKLQWEWSSLIKFFHFRCDLQRTNRSYQSILCRFSFLTGWCFSELVHVAEAKAAIRLIAVLSCPINPSISAYAQLNPRTEGIITMDLEIVIITMVDLWSEVSQAAPASAISTALLTLIGINECHFLNYMAFVQLARKQLTFTSLCCVQSVQLNNSCSCKIITLFRIIIVVPNIS